jgi:hypothetical protein
MRQKKGWAFISIGLPLPDSHSADTSLSFRTSGMLVSFCPQNEPGMDPNNVLAKGYTELSRPEGHTLAYF